MSRRIAAFTALISFLLCLFVITHFGYREHYTGDDASNEVAWIAGQNFHRFGFFKLKLVPVEQYVSESPTIPADPYNTPFYFHYPSGPSLVQGLLFTLGVQTKFMHQLISILLSLVGCFFAWRALSRLLSPMGACFAFTALVLSPSFIFFADNFHAHVYLFVLRWIFFYFIVSAYLAKKRGEPYEFLKLAAAFFGIALIASWFSLDNVIPLLSLSVLGLVLVPDNRRWSLGLLLVFVAPLAEILGFGLHIVKNGLVLGSTAAAFQDLFSVFLVRAGHATSDIHAHGAGVPYNLAKHVAKYILGLQWFFTLPVMVLATWGFVSKSARGNARMFWGLLFFGSAVGALFWQFFMRQHGMIHAFTYKHAEMYAVIGFGLFCEEAQTLFRRSLAIATLGLIILHAGLAVGQVEGVGLKRMTISVLLPEGVRTSWACVEKQRLAGSTELAGAKTLLGEWAPTCAPDNIGPHGLRPMLSSLILYLR